MEYIFDCWWIVKCDATTKSGMSIDGCYSGAMKLNTEFLMHMILMVVVNSSYLFIYWEKVQYLIKNEKVYI